MMSVSWGCHLEDKGFDQGKTTKMTSDQVIQLLDDLFMEGVKAVSYTHLRAHET